MAQRRLDPHHPGCGVDLRLDRGDLALEHLAGIGVGTQLDRLADRDRGPVPLGQGEVGVEVCQVGKGDQGVAGPDILAELHAAQAELAGERRLDQLLVDDRRLRAMPARASSSACWFWSIVAWVAKSRRTSCWVRARLARASFSLD